MSVPDAGKIKRIKANMVMLFVIQQSRPYCWYYFYVKLTVLILRPSVLEMSLIKLPIISNDIIFSSRTVRFLFSDFKLLQLKDAFNRFNALASADRKADIVDVETSVTNLASGATITFAGLFHQIILIRKQSILSICAKWIMT